MFAIKAILFLWPFLKEWFIPNMTLLEAIKHHKMSVVKLLSFAVLLLTCIFTVPRMLSISKDYLELNAKYEKLKTMNEQLYCADYSSSTEGINAKAGETPPNNDALSNGAILGTGPDNLNINKDADTSALSAEVPYESKTNETAIVKEDKKKGYQRRIQKQKNNTDSTATESYNETKSNFEKLQKEESEYKN